MPWIERKDCGYADISYCVYTITDVESTLRVIIVNNE